MADKIEQIQILLQRRIARSRGQTSSNAYNDTIDELTHDLAEFSDQWNNRLVPLIDDLPDGTVDADVDAFTNGLSGTSLYVDADATSTYHSSYYNTVRSRPNTVYEQLSDVYSQITTVREEVEEQIDDLITTASQVTIVDATSIYESTNVEDALTEVMNKADSLITAGGNNGNVQYNVNDGFGGVNEFTYDSATSHLGLGIQVPTHRLHVKHSGAGEYGVLVENPNTGVSSTAQIGLLAGTEMKGILAGMGSSGQVKLQASVDDSGYLSFYTKTATSLQERMTIANSGYVGINQTSPLYQLDVDGTVRLTGAVAVNSTVDGRDIAADGVTLDDHVSVASGVRHFLESEIDHGNILGLSDDDHTQYHNDIRGDARYYTQSQVDTIASGVNHGDLENLTDDDHSQYPLLVGRSGGQTLIGGIDSGDDLTLQSTSHVTKGHILFGTSGYDEVNNRLGIGTASPDYKLTVFGTGAGNATLQIEGEGGADPYINFLANNAQHWSLGIDDSDSDKFKISEHSALGTNDYFTVDTSGKVGIGTSSPDGKLTIQDGTLTFKNAAGDTEGYLGVKNIDGSATGDELRIRGEDGILFSIGGFAKVRIDSSGQVGIGITSPDTWLDITGDADASGTLRLRGGDGGSSYNSRQIDFSFDGGVKYSHGIATRHSNSSATDNAIDFYLWDYGTDADTDRGTLNVMSLTGDGYVGINETAPIAPLTINDHFALPSTSAPSNTAGYGKVYTDTVSKNLHFVDEDGNDTDLITAGAGDAFVGTGAAASRVAVWEDATTVSGYDGFNFLHGNLGIGTSSPSAKLDINGGVHITAGQTLDMDTDGSGNSAIMQFDHARYIALEGWQFTFSVYQNQDFIFKDDAKERMRLLANGNVGIGTASPDEKLEVEGGALQVVNKTGDSVIHLGRDRTASDDCIFNFYSNHSTPTTANAFIRKYSGADSTLRINNVDNGDIDFHTNNTARVTIENGGNVGIGEDAPLGKLHVKTADAGAISPSGSYDDLVIENSLSTGISIYSGTSNLGGIVFGDEDGDARGAVLYDHGSSLTDALQFHTAGGIKATLNSSGHLGIGTASPDGTLHAYSASAGSVTAHADADDLVVENSDSGGINILTPNNKVGNLFFGDEDDNDIGMIQYEHTSNKMWFTTNTSTAMVIDSSGQVGIGPTTPGGTLHVQTASSSATPYSEAKHLVLEGSGNSGMTILSGASSTGSIYFGDSGSNIRGGVVYVHSSSPERLGLVAGGSEGIKILTSQEVFMPAVYSDDLNGETYRDLLIKDDGQLGYDSSTIRKKTNIIDLPNVGWIYSLRPVEFERKQEDGTGNGRREIGLIAEEVNEVKDELAFTNEDGLVEGVHYKKLITPLLKAIQEQQTQITALQAEVVALRSTIGG